MPKRYAQMLPAQWINTLLAVVAMLITLVAVVFRLLDKRDFGPPNSSGTSTVEKTNPTHPTFPQ